MVDAMAKGAEEEMHEIYQFFLPLIVLEQQPGVGTRKAIYAARGLLTDPVVRHPAASLGPGPLATMQAALKRTFGDADLTQPLTTLPSWSANNARL